jgi:hypothetical protein
MKDTFEMGDAMWPVGDEVEARLAAYAAARLSPNPAAVGRMRAALMVHAAGAAALRDVAEGSLSASRGWRVIARPAPATMWVPRRPRLRRRAAALLLAATLSAGGAAAVLAATPGSLLYPTRIWFEDVTLPASSDARVDVRVDHLEQRVHEATSAAGGGNADAVAVALEAYRRELLAALRDAGNDPEQLAKLRAALGLPVAALEALGRQAPAGAGDAVDAAIDASNTAVHEIEKKVAPAPATTPNPTPATKPTPAGEPTDRPTRP